MMFFSEKVNRVLSELEKTSEIYWNVSREVAQLLFYLTRFAKVKRALEIGTSNGYSGIWLGKALEENGGKLITVESHAERFALATENFKRTELEQTVIQIFGHAPEVFSVEKEIMKGEFDLVFLDATKKQHIEFLKGIFNLTNQGGLIVVDNVLSHWEVMSKLVEYVEKIPALESQLVRVGDGLLLMYKKGDSIEPPND